MKTQSRDQLEHPKRGLLQVQFVREAVVCDGRELEHGGDLVVGELANRRRRSIYLLHYRFLQRRLRRLDLPDLRV